MTPVIPQEALNLVAESRSLCVLSGAGISAESGLATFRDQDGLWNNHPVEEVATPEGFYRNPKMVWRFYNGLRTEAAKAKPNPAHIALAEYERKKTADGKSRKVSVLTQNVDGLHKRAGSRHIIELHGSLWAARCTHCPNYTDCLPLDLPEAPECEKCGCMLRPDIVWFGEPLNPLNLIAAQEATSACDLFMVIGTSAQVYPAASYTFLAAQAGIPVIEINKEKTPASSIASFSLFGKAGEILPELLK